MAQVVWTEPALADLSAIAEYIALDKPAAARCLVREVISRVEQLSLFPQVGNKPRDLAGTPYRQLVVPPLRIFYRVTADTVFVIYVMRGEREFRIGDMRGRDR